MHWIVASSRHDSRVMFDMDEVGEIPHVGWVVLDNVVEKKAGVYLCLF